MSLPDANSPERNIIFRPGTHRAQNGRTYVFSEADVQAIAASYDPSLHQAPYVLGHPRTDAAPAWGWVNALEIQDGHLVAVAGDVDVAFAEGVEAGRYRFRSADFYGPSDPANPKPGAYYLRSVGWLALAINAGMFAVEGVAGLLSGSAALQADSLDFLGDAANYAISLGVAGMALVWRARAAMLKGATMLLFGGWVAGMTLWGVWRDVTPEAPVMGVIGFAALIANAVTAVMLFSFRNGDANMRSVWICSRNDAIGNVAVMLAAVGVLGTGTRWPDLAVAAVMAGLALQGGVQIVRQARAELKIAKASPPVFKVEARHRTPA